MNLAGHRVWRLSGNYFEPWLTAFCFQNGNSSRKKQNKKKQAKQSEPDAAKDDHVGKDSENTVQPIQNGHEGTVNVDNP